MTTTGCFGGTLGFGSFKPLGAAGSKSKKSSKNYSNIASNKAGNGSKTTMLGMKIIKPTKQTPIVKKKKS